MTEKQLSQLNDNISKLNDILQKQNSLRSNFLLSIIRGIGYFIGATIVASIMLYFFAQTLKSISNTPIFQGFIDQEFFEKFETSVP